MSNINDGFEVMATLTDDCQFVAITHFKMLRRALKPFIGKELLLTIQVLRYKRSDAQNRYMWSVIVPYVRHWLYETQGEKYKPEYVYSWLRVELLGEEPTVVEIAGREVITMTGKKFSAMNTKEFAEAVDTIRAEMLLRGLDIPEPQKGKRHNLISEFLEDD